MKRQGPFRRIFGITVVAAAAALSLGCVSDDPAPPRGDQSGSGDVPRNGLDKPITVVGVLRGGMAGIGGEHTGWQMERPGGLSPIEVDVSKVPARARKFEGRRVALTGRMVDRDYVERGRVRILQVNKIDQAAAGGKPGI